MGSNKGFTSSTITSFLKYFSEEREVYVQNMSNTQISLSFGSGETAFHTTIPRTRKPYVLTQYVPFDAIKNSFDFRKIVTRRNPPILRLIDEEEYEAYYSKLAHRNKTSIDEELAKAQDVMENLVNKRTAAPERMQREMESLLEEKIEKLESPPEIHPRVIGLCAQADKEQGFNRISSDDFLDELETLSADLGADDWEFISTKGVYKRVKKFASEQLDELVIDDDDDE